MPDPMQEIMASFFVECEELHETLLDALQTMADGEHESETINIAFRAVHSIKGGAGAFGLDDLVGFAHQLETVMDGCRSGDLALANCAVRLWVNGGQIQDAIIVIGGAVARARRLRGTEQGLSGCVTSDAIRVALASDWRIDAAADLLPDATAPERYLQAMLPRLIAGTIGDALAAAST